MPAPENSSSSLLTSLVRNAPSLLTVLVLPAVLMLVVFAAKYDGLREPMALDHAQLARHVAGGEGLTTNVIRPLSAGFKAQITPHPDLYNAPIHPLLLAAVFKSSEASERVAVGFTAVLWVISIWATFALACHWFGWRAGMLAAFLYSCNVSAITASMGALPHPLYALITIGALFLALPKRRPAANITGTEEHEVIRPDDQIPLPQPTAVPWRAAAAGLVCALAMLTHFPLGGLAVVLGWSLIAASANRTRTFLLFLGGFAAGLAPWLIRNALVAGSPLFNLYSYEALSGTGQFPGDTVWRFATPPDHPALFLVHHPVQAVIKIVSGLNRFRQEIIQVMDLFVVVPFLAAAFDTRFASRWRWPIRIGLFGVILTAIIGSILKPETNMLLAWTPLYCAISAGWFIEWLPGSVRRLGEAVSRRSRPAERGYARSWAEWWAQAGANVAIAVLLLMPMMNYVLVDRPPKDNGALDQMEALRKRTSDNAVVLTDQPELVAWHTDRRAIWLPQREQDLVTMEQTFGAADATLVSKAAAQLPLGQRGDWWYWVTVPTGVYRGLAVVEPSPPNAILRVRTKAALR